MEIVPEVNGEPGTCTCGNIRISILTRIRTGSRAGKWVRTWTCGMVSCRDCQIKAFREEPQEGAV